MFGTLTITKNHNVPATELLYNEDRLPGFIGDKHAKGEAQLERGALQWDTNREAFTRNSSPVALLAYLLGSIYIDTVKNETNFVNKSTL
ncbi:hypothetical protein ANTRET_LOCUS9169 [Anthophora retusa]